MKYTKIINFFTYLTEKHDLYICIKDFHGFLPVNPDYEASFQPFLAHVNPFCLYMKSDKAVYSRCLSMTKGMSKKFLKSKKSFCGSCHVGLTEYVVPIMREEQVLGSINVGFFNKDNNLVEERLKTICENSLVLDYDIALEIFNKTITPTSMTFPMEFLLPSLEIAAEYLANTYPDVEKLEAEKANHNSSEDIILSHALNYIKDNLTSKIYVDDIANFCYCSPSHLSHIFKKRTKTTLNSYINANRVELAKKYLHGSSMSIADISTFVGFEDPNYFSRIFTKVHGLSPKNFRNEYVK